LGAVKGDQKVVMASQPVKPEPVGLS
jgi:hypothetical protein